MFVTALMRLRTSRCDCGMVVEACVHHCTNAASRLLLCRLLGRWLRRTGAARRLSVLDERMALFVEVEAEVLRELLDGRAPLAPGSRSLQSPPAIFSSRSGSCAAHPLDQLGEEPLDLVDHDPVDVAVGGRVDLHHLLLDRHRVALGLVERLHEPLAASQRPLGLRVELGPELGERLELAVLRELELQAARDPAHRRALGVAADPRDRDADVDRRAHAGVEEARLEVDLPVGDRDHVRRDVGRHVTGLGLDHRQSGQRPAAGSFFPVLGSVTSSDSLTARSSNRECR